MNKYHKKTYQEILNIQKKFNKRLQEDIEHSYGSILILLTTSILFVPIILLNSGIMEDTSGFIIPIISFIGIPIGLVGLFYIFRYINKKIGRYIQEFFKDILCKISLLHDEFAMVDDIDIILEKLNSIFNIFRTLRTKRLMLNIFGSPIIRGYFLEYCNSINQYLIVVMKDLRSDLTLRLTEQQSALEQAKSEVSTHIHGTDELNQVSELQRQRLDQQIAQFEELQRVLVRV